MSVGKIFLNYRRDDSEGYVGRLYDHLTHRFPGRVFRDVTGLRPGEDFVNALDREGINCQVLLAIIGKRWLAASDSKGQRRLDDPEDILRREIVHALQRNILVIPVLVGSASMPPMEDLPPDLRPLGRRQALPISELDFEHDLERLINVLSQELHCQPAPTAGAPFVPPPTVAQQPAPAKPKRLRWIIGSSIGTIVLLGVIGTMSNNRQAATPVATSSDAGGQNQLATNTQPEVNTQPASTLTQPANKSRAADSPVRQATPPATQPVEPALPAANSAAAANWQKQLVSSLAGMNTARVQMASIFGSSPQSIQELQYLARQLLSVLDGYDQQVDSFKALLKQGESDGYLVTATDRAQAAALHQVCDIRKLQSSKYRQEAQLVLQYNPYATQYAVLQQQLMSVQGEINALDVRAAGLMQQAGLQ